MSNSATATFIGSINGTTLTITSVSTGVILPFGQTICGNNLISSIFLDPTTVITGPLSVNLDGTGTYTVNIPQNVSSITMYASVLPISQVPLTPTTTFLTDLSTTLNSLSAIINVNSTAGFPSLGYIIIGGLALGDIGCIVSYSSTTPTQFVGCTCGFGSGLGITLPQNTSVIQPSTPSILFSFVNTQQTPSMTAATDGRLWTTGYSSSTNYWFNTNTIRFKSPSTNSQFTDIVQSNYAGPWQIQNQLFTYGASVPSGSISFPVDTYFPNDKSILWDEQRGALYAILWNRINIDLRAVPDPTAPITPPASVPSQNMTITFIISRDNGMTWSDPIYVSNTNFANRGFGSLALDPITGNLLFGWYDGRNTSVSSPDAFQTLEYFGAVILSSKLDALVNEIPYSNPVFQSGPATGEPPLAPSSSFNLKENAQTQKRLRYRKSNPIK